MKEKVTRAWCKVQNTSCSSPSGVQRKYQFDRTSCTSNQMMLCTVIKPSSVRIGWSWRHSYITVEQLKGKKRYWKGVEAFVNLAYLHSQMCLLECFTLKSLQNYSFSRIFQHYLGFLEMQRFYIKHFVTSLISGYCFKTAVVFSNSVHRRSYQVSEGNCCDVVSKTL